MAEPAIRYVRTKDGVSVAYSVSGEGPPLVRVLGWFTHLELEQQGTVWKVFTDLSSRLTVVRYDGRGVGLSDRTVSDFSLDGKVRDLEAVVDALRLRRFALIGTSEGGATAIAYAVQHPRRVSHLILYGSFARFRFRDREQQEAMLTLTRHAWDEENPAVRQMFSALFIPEASGEEIRWFNEFQRASASTETATRFMLALVGIDVRKLCPQVKAPTLVVHRREEQAVPFDNGKQLAALIPGARFLPLEGRNHMLLPHEAQYRPFVEAVADFVGATAPVEAGPAPSGEASLVTILFTDIEGSTRITRRLGDTRAQQLVRTHNAIVREALKAHGGSEIKHTGDGIMASFPSTSRALDCAVIIQRTIDADNRGPRPSRRDPLVVRIGLNAGEPVVEDADLFGTAVQLARRICDQAGGGEIIASNVVRELAAGKGFQFADRGEVVPKGFDEPVRLYEVRWRG